jgi:hypothetical protein
MRCFLAVSNFRPLSLPCTSSSAGIQGDGWARSKWRVRVSKGTLLIKVIGCGRFMQPRIFCGVTTKLTCNCCFRRQQEPVPSYRPLILSVQARPRIHRTCKYPQLSPLVIVLIPLLFLFGESSLNLIFQAHAAMKSCHLDQSCHKAELRYIKCAPYHAKHRHLQLRLSRFASGQAEKCQPLDRESIFSSVSSQFSEASCFAQCLFRHADLVALPTHHT